MGVQYELQSYFFPQNHPVIKHYFHFFCFIPNPSLHFCPPSCFQALWVLLVIGGGGKNSRDPKRHSGAYVLLVSSGCYKYLSLTLRGIFCDCKEITNNALEVGEYFLHLSSNILSHPPTSSFY